MPQAFQGWYKHDIDAWRGSAAVQDMTDAEYRAFHNLLMAQFESEDGMLPADEKELARMSRKRAEWQVVREVVLEQFESGGDGRIYNPRMFYEWQQAKQLSEQRSAGGKSTAAKRYSKPAPSDEGGGSTPPAQQQQSARTATAQQQDGASTATTQQPVITERNGTLRDEEEKQERTRKPTSDELLLVYHAYPRHVGRAKALDEIERAVVRLAAGKHLPPMMTCAALAYLHGKVLAFARSPSGQQGDFTPHPATWFHQERYFDNEQEWQRSGDGTDRQQQRNGQQSGVGSPAQQRVEGNRTLIAAAFSKRRGTGGDGEAGVADGGELCQPDAGGWAGGVVDGAVVRNHAEARPGHAP